MKKLIFILFLLPILVMGQVISKQIVRLEDLGTAIRFVQIDSSYIDLQKTSVGFITLYPLPQKSVQVVPIAGGSNNYTFGFQYDAITPLYASQYVLADTLNAWIGRGGTSGGGGGGGGGGDNIYNSNGTIPDGTNRIADVRGTLIFADTAVQNYKNFYSFIAIGDSLAFPDGMGGYTYFPSNGVAQYSVFSNGNNQTAIASVGAASTGSGLGAVNIATDANTNESLGVYYAYDTTNTDLISNWYYTDPVGDENIMLSLTEDDGFYIYPYSGTGGVGTFKGNNIFSVNDTLGNRVFGVTADGAVQADVLSATRVQIEGTNGNGSIHLKHQASDATATGSSTSLFADNAGDLKYKNDNLYYTTFKTSGNTANREYRFPDSTGTVALNSQVDSKTNKLLSFQRNTSSDTLSITDADKVVEMNVGSANNLCVPANADVSFPVGTQILISQYGAGQTTIVALSGVTIRSADSKTKLSKQYSMATLIKVGTNEWYLAGDITN